MCTVYTNHKCVMCTFPSYLTIFIFLLLLGRGQIPTGSGQQGSSTLASTVGDLLFDRIRQATSGNPTAANLERLLGSASAYGASSGGPSTANPSATPNPILTPELVARAMSTALNSLPPEAREARFHELRGMSILFCVRHTSYNNVKIFFA